MKRYFLFCILIVVAFQSCSIDDDTNFNFVQLEVVEANLPDAFNLNETVTIDLTYLRPNDCTFFRGLDIVPEAKTTRSVAIVGSLLTDNEDCADVNQQIETSFNFEVLYPETYLFRFYTGTDENGAPQFMEIEVPVNTGPTTNQ
ncbi:hypothetical protein [Spongiimicrobium salis]|uniref:hypothetical protein n=1 Tax=Spongiimicrobium salis TaxID=1667022 RepID=UPI00374CA335